MLSISRRHEVTKGGKRTLVAAHGRRGDYRGLQTYPQFRLVPEEMYIRWLRGIWPKLPDPVLFVASDEAEVLEFFTEFERLPAPGAGATRALPRDLFDFRFLRRADVLAICNSSFSRMAAILADDAQRCFLPSFETWVRFSGPQSRRSKY